MCCAAPHVAAVERPTRPARWCAIDRGPSASVPGTIPSLGARPRAVHHPYGARERKKAVGTWQTGLRKIFDLRGHTGSRTSSPPPDFDLSPRSAPRDRFHDLCTAPCDRATTRSPCTAMQEVRVSRFCVGTACATTASRRSLVHPGVRPIMYGMIDSIYSRCCRLPFALGAARPSRDATRVRCSFARIP